MRLPHALRSHDARLAEVSGNRMVNSSPPVRAMHVIRAQHRLCLSDQRLQRAVAGGMSTRVVEVLEVVDVEHDHAERMAMADASRGLAHRDLLHRPAVQRTGQ